ncbi:MAG TPA: HEAT repeat domain-containing protein [Vicinamibacterales bacterium]|nr:HEAT repeat domain-containing protein [Vicinamibacterales bacterium]
MAPEKGVRVGGLIIAAVVTWLGVAGSIALGAWSFNLVAGVLSSAMTGDRSNTPATNVAMDLVRLRESASPLSRFEAAERLARSNDHRAVDGLTTALGDVDARVRRRAALALGQIGDPAAAPALTDALENSADPELRYAAAAALGVLHHRRAARSLRDQENPK